MKLENEFTVEASIGQAWETVLDLKKVTQCVPGASLTEETGEDGYRGTMKIQLGPLTQEYNGSVNVEEASEKARRRSSKRRVRTRAVVEQPRAHHHYLAREEPLDPGKGRN
jgi:carbon monoxide dehydrogenase subunit G